MRAAAIVALFAALLSCSDRPPAPSPSPRALPFSVIRSGSADSCVVPPELAVARNEDEWIDVFDFETDCNSRSDVTLPDVDLERGPVIAAWLRPARCAREAVTVRAVRLSGEELELEASSEPRPEPCRPPERRVLEAFVQTEGSAALDGVRSVTAVLDGQRVASFALR